MRSMRLHPHILTPDRELHVGGCGSPCMQVSLPYSKVERTTDLRSFTLILVLIPLWYQSTPQVVQTARSIADAGAIMPLPRARVFRDGASMVLELLHYRDSSAGLRLCQYHAWRWLHLTRRSWREDSTSPCCTPVLMGNSLDTLP